MPVTRLMLIRAISLIAACCSLAAQSPQIYSSGPIVTNLGAAMNGGNLSALQVQGATPFFMTTIGHGAWRSNPSSTLELGIVDAFATNGTWLVDGLQFYCYQTGVSLPSISGVYVEIYSGDPATGGQPIAGSPGLANNLFATPGYQVGNVMTNVYRASLATPRASRTPCARASARSRPTASSSCRTARPTAARPGTRACSK